MTDEGMKKESKISDTRFTKIIIDLYPWVGIVFGLIIFWCARWFSRIKLILSHFNI